MHLRRSAAMLLVSAVSALAAPAPSVVPLPERMALDGGTFTLTADTVILADAAAAGEARYLADLLAPATGMKLNVVSSGAPAKAIVMKLSPKFNEGGDEGYALRVTPANITLLARTPAGLFHGVQTLRQLMPVPLESKAPVAGVAWTVPGVDILDRPRFPWRGAMLDVCRHMLSVDDIKKFIDLMALHKLNTLHWHLTDDQGWRIEIKKYPRLTEVGSWRDESPVEGNRNQGDGKRYGGFFTQDQAREVVAYAAARHITVVPEIEMPGHALGALTAYPELGCVGGPYRLRTKWGVEPDVFCAGNDKVYDFVQDVLTEVMAVFPGTFLHVGGDECPKDRWKKCPKCQARIRAEGLKDEHELQSYFIRRMDKFLAAHGRRLIGWDEILEGGLAPGAAVMSWRGIKGGIQAAREGHDVVMTPTSHCYLDYAQAKGPGEPESIGGHVPLRQVYGFEPVPAEVPEPLRKHILGAQGNLWSEYLFNYSRVEYFAFPRLCAVAEITWTPADKKDFVDFRRRLDAHLPRLDALGVNYRKPESELVIGGWTPSDVSTNFATREWDLTPYLNGTTPQSAVFQYHGGEHRLDIAWAAVVVDGREAHRDTHEGTTGAKDKNNAYNFVLPAMPAGARAVLRASIRADGGTDSRGEITLKAK